MSELKLRPLKTPITTGREQSQMPPRGKRRAKAGYMISAVAELYKLHPQTLRLYERVGLLKPSRSQGNTRLYTDEDLERLDVILTLARDMGVNLAGIEIILNMREKMVEMERQMTEFATVVQQELARVSSLRGEAVPRNAIVRAVPPRAVRFNVRES
jgi:MerR family transcriptional regulator, heat shock protein HspR